MLRLHCALTARAGTILVLNLAHGLEQGTQVVLVVISEPHAVGSSPVGYE